MDTQNVYVVLVNWNGWKDTIECLESLFRSSYSEFTVIVCDNNSTDGSAGRIVSWAAGELPPPTALNPTLRHLSFPPIPKPLAIRRLRTGVENLPVSEITPRLVLIENSSNLGFAGANNVGIRYALSRGDASFLWLLNNDTVASPDAMGQLVKHMGRDLEVGILGSKLVFYSNESQVQALGGARYNKWIARGSDIGAHSSPSQRSSVSEVCAAMDYVVGASMFVSVRFVQDIGLLNEEFFLYFEELDWALRSKGRFRLGFCEKSIVYHKNGASTHAGVPSKPSLTADFYSTRNKISFTQRYFPSYLPSVYAYLLVRAVRRILQGAYKNAYVITRLILGRGNLSSYEEIKNQLSSRS